MTAPDRAICIAAALCALAVGAVALLSMPGCTETFDPSLGGRCFLGENLVDRYEYITCLPSPTPTP